ncbi:DUF4019 domain-containing protein [Novosphingobium sp. 9]|uniref:DUF4019 domain-containing protein n=1 Tax=Novosphingobium sp. 9 TaxID=2025349 RepID=UPI0021B4EF46|nr:DUF4019 domain-containing protein [Novosphingobium sp. 9]
MNRLARYVLPITALAMAGATLSGCNVKQSIASADSEVAQFHRQLDAGQWQAIWAGGGPKLHSGTSEAAFGKLLTAVHTKLGAVKSTKQVGWNVNAGTGGSTVTVTMQTSFAKGTGTEQFVFAKVDGAKSDSPEQGGKGGQDKLVLASYGIESQDMMLN